ncbi:unnamed protein product [Durusdinium trenchii]|uniref:Uncharacterized protein n=1 Tax=Durusdinium trenchii TaxID=1381693 RepID=A0ABP0MT10_9DINO
MSSRCTSPVLLVIVLFGGSMLPTQCFLGGVLLLRRSALLLLAAPAWMPASALPGSPRFAGKYDDPDYPGALALREGIVPVIRMMGCWWTSHPEDQSFIRWIEQTCSC